MGQKKISNLHIVTDIKIIIYFNLIMMAKSFYLCLLVVSLHIVITKTASNATKSVPSSITPAKANITSMKVINATKDTAKLDAASKPTLTVEKKEDSKKGTPKPVPKTTLAPAKKEDPKKVTPKPVPKTTPAPAKKEEAKKVTPKPVPATTPAPAKKEEAKKV